MNECRLLCNLRSTKHKQLRLLILIVCWLKNWQDLIILRVVYLYTNGIHNLICHLLSQSRYFPGVAVPPGSSHCLYLLKCPTCACSRSKDVKRFSFIQMVSCFYWMTYRADVLSIYNPRTSDTLNNLKSAAWSFTFRYWRSRHTLVRVDISCVHVLAWLQMCARAVCVRTCECARTCLYKYVYLCARSRVCEYMRV